MDQKFFEIKLHSCPVQLHVCDAMALSLLQQTIRAPYGTFAFTRRSVYILRLGFHNLIVIAACSHFTSVAFVLGLIFWDMPFGLGLAPWDVLLTDEEVKLFFQQLGIINTSRQSVLALIVHLRDAGRMMTAMEDNGWLDVHPVYIYKPSQNQKGTNCFIFAVEVTLVGYRLPKS